MHARATTDTRFLGFSVSRGSYGSRPIMISSHIRRSTGSAGLIQTISRFSSGSLASGILGIIATVGWTLQGVGLAWYYRNVRGSNRYRIDPNGVHARQNHRLFALPLLLDEPAGSPHFALHCLVPSEARPPAPAHARRVW